MLVIRRFEYERTNTVKFMRRFSGSASTTVREWTIRPRNFPCPVDTSLCPDFPRRGRSRTLSSGQTRMQPQNYTDLRSLLESFTWTSLRYAKLHYLHAAPGTTLTTRIYMDRTPHPPTKIGPKQSDRKTSGAELASTRST